MTIKDFKVGDEVIYLDFNGRSSIEQATIKTGYVKYVGRKVVKVSKFKDDEHDYDFVISDSGLYLEINHNCSCFSRYDLVFRSKEDYEMYTKYRQFDKVVDCIIKSRCKHKWEFFDCSSYDCMSDYIELQCKKCGEIKHIECDIDTTKWSIEYIGGIN